MGTVKLTYREAVRSALRHALATDERVFLMGEDVGAYGGGFAVSLGLLEEFGPTRVRDTPLSESGFVGAGIGAALGGMRPIVEVMTINFSLLAFDQIVNNAATLRYMSGGQLSVPLVVRMATGGGRQLAAQHAQVHDFGVDSGARQLVGGGHRLAQRAAVGEQAHVGSGASDGGLVDIDGARIGRNLAFEVIEAAVLEDEHRIGIFERRPQHPARILERRRR